MKREALDEILARTFAEDARERRRAAGELCPCAVKANLPGAWARLIAMVDDPDPTVRSVVLHALCDGTPADRQAEVAAALEVLRHDDDHRLRRRARRALDQYRRTGRVNE